MLTEKQMQEIQDLKLRGYSINEITKYYEERNLKTPTLPTIKKYYNMDTLPKEPNLKLEKEKAFDHDPFRSAIIEIIRNNCKKRHCISSVYDVLTECFIENGYYETLAGNEQTLRNYVHYLIDNGIIEKEPENRRIYDPELMLYVEVEDEVIATVLSFLENNGNITIGMVATNEKYRKKGIAKKLMLMIEKRAKELGVHLIALGSAETAEGFYTKLGYTGQLLIQSQKHTIEELLTLNPGYPIAFTNIYDGDINQVCLKLPNR